MEKRYADSITILTSSGRGIPSSAGIIKVKIIFLPSFFHPFLSPHTYAHIHINISNTHTYILSCARHIKCSSPFPTQSASLGAHHATVRDSTWVITGFFFQSRFDKKTLYFMCSSMEPFGQAQCCLHWCFHGPQSLNPHSLGQSKAIAFWSSEIFQRNIEGRNTDSVTHFQFPTWFWKLFEPLSFCNPKQRQVMCNILPSNFCPWYPAKDTARHFLTGRIKTKLVASELALWSHTWCDMD